VLGPSPLLFTGVLVDTADPSRRPKQAVSPSPAAARSAHRRGQVGSLPVTSPDTPRSTSNPGLEVLRGVSREATAESARGWGGLSEGRVDGLQWVTG
jgi:hypothetical protein